MALRALAAGLLASASASLLSLYTCQGGACRPHSSAVPIVTSTELQVCTRWGQPWLARAVTGFAISRVDSPPVSDPLAHLLFPARSSRWT